MPLRSIQERASSLGWRDVFLPSLKVLKALRMSTLRMSFFYVYIESATKRANSTYVNNNNIKNFYRAAS